MQKSGDKWWKVGYTVSIKSVRFSVSASEGEFTGMLIGSYEHSLDAKGRVFIPAKWRETLGDSMILMEGLLESKGIHCLYGMSVSEWETFSERLSSLPATDMAGQAVRRHLYASAAVCDIDRQGRILLPASLRALSAIEKDVLLVGVGNRIELWDPMQYNRYNETTEDNYGMALEHLSQMGI